MNFRNKTTEAGALEFGFMAIDVACGVAFRLLDGRWPSPGFWLSGVVAYVLVAAPARRRSRTDADDGGPT